MAQQLLVVNLHHPRIIARAPVSSVEAHRIVATPRGPRELNEAGRQQNARQPVVFRHLAHEATQVVAGWVAPASTVCGLSLAKKL